jgi:hypothetical protein
MTPHADPTVLERNFRDANAEFKNIEGELEDLLGSQLLQHFVRNIRMRSPVSAERETLSIATSLVTARRDFTVLRRITQYARDLAKVAGVLKSFRGYFGLKEDGCVDLPASCLRSQT